MTKFEQNGINFQMESRSVREAQRNFVSSCNVCCCRGMRINCDYCAIAAAHSMTLASFASLQAS